MVSKGDSSGVRRGVVRCRENQLPPGALPVDFETVRAGEDVEG